MNANPSINQCGLLFTWKTQSGYNKHEGWVMQAYKNTIIFFLLAFLLGNTAFSLHAQEYASRGSVTEALFILQNKHRDLAEHVQKLKKRLTDCFAQQKELSSPCITKSRTRRVKLYKDKGRELNLCALYQKLFPPSIKELEQLVATALERINHFSTTELVKSDELKWAVDRAFLVQKKIKIESKLISLVTHIDENEWKLKKSSSSLHARKIQNLTRDSLFLRKKIRAEASSLAKINKQLYKGSGSKKTFLAELRRYLS